MHSSSVIDCFSAFDQAVVFIKGIKFLDSTIQAQMMNRLGGVITRNLQFYCSALYSDSVSQFQVIKKSRFNIFHSSKQKYALPYEISAQNLVKLNNLEAARKFLHQLYDHIDVEGVMTMLQTSQLHPSKELGDSGEGFSGNLQIVVMKARGLRACDSNGRSDPYTVITLRDQVLCKTRTIESKKSLFLSLFVCLCVFICYCCCCCCLTSFCTPL